MTNTTNQNPRLLRYPVSKIRKAISNFLRTLPEDAADSRVTVPTVRYKDETGGGGIIFSCGGMLVTFHLSPMPSIDGGVGEIREVEGLTELLKGKIIL